LKPGDLVKVVSSSPHNGKAGIFFETIDEEYLANPIVVFIDGMRCQFNIYELQFFENKKDSLLK